MKWLDPESVDYGLKIIVIATAIAIILLWIFGFPFN
jgi:hypothetical protein